MHHIKSHCHNWAGITEDPLQIDDLYGLVFDYRPGHMNVCYKYGYMLVYDPRYPDKGNLCGDIKIWVRKHVFQQES